MPPEFQTVAALVLVAAAAIWLVRRSLARKGKPGCGGDCGCASQEIRASARAEEKAAARHG